jgi:hypothetical protein
MITCVYKNAYFPAFIWIHFHHGPFFLHISPSLKQIFYKIYVVTDTYCLFVPKAFSSNVWNLQECKIILRCSNNVRSTCISNSKTIDIKGVIDGINVPFSKNLRSPLFLLRNSSVNTTKIRMVTTIPAITTAIQALPLSCVLRSGYTFVFVDVSFSLEVK